MSFLLNELSLHGQFTDARDFESALERVMRIRAVISKAGQQLACSRSLGQAHITTNPDRSLQQWVGRLGRDKQRALMSWINQQGPFWNEPACHSDDDYLQCNDEIVTASSVGEAAWSCLHYQKAHVISFSPSDWQTSPLMVDWHDGQAVRAVNVENYWELTLVREVLQSAEVPLASWGDLQERVRQRCSNLTFTDASFQSLGDQPFAFSAAKRLQFLFEMLNEFVDCFDVNGKRTDRGNELYQDYFTGDRARFSDSSNDEKSHFCERLTFPHPEREAESLFCPMHGKVQTPQYRFHFSWPIQAGQPVYIVYVGPKLTKR